MYKCFLFLFIDMLFLHQNIMKDTLIGHQNIPIAGTRWMSDQKETLLVRQYIYQSTAKYSQVCIKIPKYSQACIKIPKYSQVCIKIPKYSQVCIKIPKYSQVCIKIPKYSQVCIKIPMYSQV
jgi:hypothetical protein